MEHTIRDHLFTFRNCFEFFNSIGHYFNVIYVSAVRAGQSTVSVQGCGLCDVTTEHGMPDAYPGDGVAMNKRDRIACHYPVATLQRELRSTGVRKAYVVAPG